MEITLQEIQDAYQDYLNEWVLFSQENGIQLFFSRNGEYKVVGSSGESHFVEAREAVCTYKILTNSPANVVSLGAFVVRTRTEWVNWYLSTKDVVSIDFRFNKFRLTKGGEIAYLGPCPEHLMDELE